MITSFQKVSFMNNATNFDQKQLAVDITEVILRWEAQRVLDMNSAAGVVVNSEMIKPFEKHVADSVLTFFIKMSCTAGSGAASSASDSGTGSTYNEYVSRRCLNLFKVAIENEIWPNADIKFEILDRVFMTLEQTAQSPQLFKD